MTARKREPRAITVAEIEQQFELASYWFGDKWCPAVHRTGHGYGIRVLKSETLSLGHRQVTYDYFELDRDGVVDTAPRGFAKDWKPGRVIDIEAAAERFATPDREAGRVR